MINNLYYATLITSSNGTKGEVFQYLTEENRYKSIPYLVYRTAIGGEIKYFDFYTNKEIEDARNSDSYCVETLSFIEIEALKNSSYHYLLEELKEITKEDLLRYAHNLEEIENCLKTESKRREECKLKLTSLHDKFIDSLSK